MDSVEIKVSDAFALKESFNIVLEVTNQNLTTKQVENINSFQEKINSNSTEINLPLNIKEDLILCIGLFTSSHTWVWLRENFRDSIEELSFVLKQLNK
jgi:hypothetical protein